MKGLRRLLLAIVRDLRVIPILLARQLAWMRHASRLPEDERRALAQLTRDIHAPLANRLGIWQLKWELEDLAFRTWNRIPTSASRACWTTSAVAASVHRAGQADAARGARRAGHAGRSRRPAQAHLSASGKRCRRRTCRSASSTTCARCACWSTISPPATPRSGVVHALWPPVPGEFDDYIARPKRNDYRSLHTAVIGPEGKALEVQIRTYEMHAQAELGVAAHWRYKEGRGVEHRSRRRRRAGPQDRLDAPAARQPCRARRRQRRPAGRTSTASWSRTASTC